MTSHYFLRFFYKAALFLFIPLISCLLWLLIPAPCTSQAQEQQAPRESISPALSIKKFTLTHYLDHGQLLTIKGQEGEINDMINHITNCMITSDHVCCSAESAFYDVKTQELSLHGSVTTIIDHKS